MTSKKKASNRSNRETKKAMVMKAGKKSPLPIIIAAVAAIAVAAVMSLFLFSGNTSLTASTTGTPDNAPSVQNGRITYAASMFEDGKARHFHYADAASGTTINYFILKSTDGIIRAAFDACDVCWRSGKGYYQEGSTMVCRNCGRRFESVKVNEVQGGCNPAPLLRTMEGDQVVIKVEDIRKGSGFFNFSGKA